MMSLSMLFLALLAAVGIGTFVTGIVLLAVGLAKHVKGMWIAGVVCLCVFLLSGLSLPAMGMLWWFRAARPATVSTIRSSPSTRAELHEALGLPADVEVPDATAVSSWAIGLADESQALYVQVNVSPRFQDILANHFLPVAWKEAEPLFAQAEETSWDMDVLKGLPCYRRLFTDEKKDPCVALVCYDRQAGRAYCLMWKPAAALGSRPVQPRLDGDP